MGLLKKVILAAGLATLVLLVWKFDPKLVWAELSDFGWAFAVIIPFQLFDHALNALGWRFTFPEKHARAVPFWRLIYARVAGDGVNYLTPSANIAGEFVRPALLGPVAPDDVKIMSVVLGKLTQALGQTVFIVAGLLLVVQGQLDFLEPGQKVFGLAAAGLTGAGVLTALWLLTHPGKLGDRIWGLASRLGSVRAPLRAYVEGHRKRLALSIFFFMLGYAWGALEVWLACRFMGLTVSLKTALAVEVLSNVVDSLLFMVPAKMGTQEAGKTLIFKGLGLPARSGLAFGLIRHIRELVWAAAGLALFVAHQRATGQARSR